MPVRIEHHADILVAESLRDVIARQYRRERLIGR
jgi:hypothetical protein